MVSVLFFVLLGIFVYLQWLSPIALVIYAGISCCGFFLYGRDKSAAQTGKWRIRESSLHLVGLLGGWPGALLAQRFFHHKTRKTSFQVLFWLTVVGNCAVLGCLVAPH